MRAIILAIGVSIAAISATELLFRATGGVPSIPLGKTPVEFQWKIKRAEPGQTIFVVGDSRIEWGFAEHVFNRELQSHGGKRMCAVNAGFPAASAASIVKYILQNHPGQPGVMAINFSPCSFFQFAGSPGNGVKTPKVQDLIDDRISCFMKERLWTYGRRPTVLLKHLGQTLNHSVQREVIWYGRTVFPEGFVRVKGRYNDGSVFDQRSWTLNAYRKMFDSLNKERDSYTKRKVELAQIIQEAREAGWKILLLRLPVGQEMLKLEGDLPKELSFAQVVAELGLPCLDYQADPRMEHFTTVDESHLTSESAREIAMLLSQDIWEFLTVHNKSSKPESRGR